MDSCRAEMRLEDTGQGQSPSRPLLPAWLDSNGNRYRGNFRAELNSLHAIERRLAARRRPWLEETEIEGP
ncbi:hypothetical protein SKAU_G00040240 [Synaphobranchus kaupii]|uniref:Uncharacterized protein n=1 Tax=Synaphobranchus kaupii TaxID=118154 RepID=A0A9Q1G117_SYNKA|nr:hypothetical protein SKAU_G00040240 [Synaphobranchus kaupii]